MSVKRIGLAVGLLVAVVFATEFVLSGLRTRNVDVTFRVESARGTQFIQDETALVLRPRSGFIVDVRWNYRIGPRFPVTRIRAEIQQDDGQVVAAQEYTIDCGTSTVDCVGIQPLAMAFGQRAAADSAQPWREGKYTLSITREYSGQTAVRIVERPITVLQQDN